jgi:hypothetical protein
MRVRGKQLKIQFKKKKKEKKKDQTGPNIYKFLSFLPQDFYFCFLPKKKKKKKKSHNGVHMHGLLNNL